MSVRSDTMRTPNVRPSALCPQTRTLVGCPAACWQRAPCRSDGDHNRYRVAHPNWEEEEELRVSGSQDALYVVMMSTIGSM